MIIKLIINFVEFATNINCHNYWYDLVEFIIEIKSLND